MVSTLVASEPLTDECRKIYVHNVESVCDMLQEVTSSQTTDSGNCIDGFVWMVDQLAARIVFSEVNTIGPSAHVRHITSLSLYGIFWTVNKLSQALAIMHTSRELQTSFRHQRFYPVRLGLSVHHSSVQFVLTRLYSTFSFIHRLLKSQVHLFSSTNKDLMGLVGWKEETR